MTTTVRAYKGLMTKRSQVALAWLEESTQRLQHLKGKSTQQEQVKEFTMTVARCDEYLELLEASLTKLTEAFDKLQDTTDEEEDQLDKHAEIAQETIMKLYAHKSNTKQMLQEITTAATLRTSGTDHQCSAAETWDRYWSLESTGTEEYTGPQKTELQKTNEKVLENFKESIEKREDGYYVRLPWKENHPELPDNKALAMKRLAKILEIYQKDPKTLQAYDNIFKEQQEKGIIEEVISKYIDEGEVVYYLPHQAEVNRRILNKSDGHRLVVFTVASQCAIAACAYLTSQEESSIIMAKSKIPSIKTSMTVPKLEMNALTLGVRMSHFICDALEPLCNIKEVILYTDSDIVLGWIHTPPSRQSAGVLVTNRLTEIRRISNDLRGRNTTCLFGHVSTAENPADCGTRGLSSEAFQNHFWWTGPSFTSKPDHSKLNAIEGSETTMMPVETVTLAVTERTSEKELVDLTRFSTLERAQRVLVYVLRFIHRSINHLPHERKVAVQEHISALKGVSMSQTITGVEMQESQMCLIRDHQRIYVDEHQIKSQKDLNIQRDERGVLRCYGRMQQSDVPITAKTPIYIAPRTTLARLIISEDQAREELNNAIMELASEFKQQQEETRNWVQQQIDNALNKGKERDLQMNIEAQRQHKLLLKEISDTKQQIVELARQIKENRRKRPRERSPDRPGPSHSPW
ncbi:unnamed protein product [Cylicocyclus nassatus]|uniref:Uncharacterized protein n=1 Tax=Cylicocyclus nassatus TaxID=53992 RepID=A0AA36GME5_CYLNA|nr:unnamed protein product [Cylicocyclus nassatus]